MLEAKFQRKVKAEVSVDSELIGGVRIKLVIR
ncbi:MAG: F0F1 ATP synthase subunit delta [Nitrosomonas sp.]|nr:F0F1 ATP synthase subunit delta [Nitrosomonas sp.]